MGFGVFWHDVAAETPDPAPVSTVALDEMTGDVGTVELQEPLV